MDSNNSNSVTRESGTQPSAIKTLRRFFFVAWHVFSFDAITQALLTLVHGCILVRILGETHYSKVLQDFIQYNLTEHENIIFCDIEHPERMEAASITGGADAVVARRTEGYDTTLDSTFSGRDLSGGEWHRLSSGCSCDRIVVIDNGTVVEDGNHETLLAKEGLYAQFFNAQTQRYVEV